MQGCCVCEGVVCKGVVCEGVVCVRVLCVRVLCVCILYLTLAKLANTNGVIRSPVYDQDPHSALNLDLPNKAWKICLLNLMAISTDTDMYTHASTHARTHAHTHACTR